MLCIAERAEAAFLRILSHRAGCFLLIQPVGCSKRLWVKSTHL